MPFGSRYFIPNFDYLNAMLRGTQCIVQPNHPSEDFMRTTQGWANRGAGCPPADLNIGFKTERVQAEFWFNLFNFADHQKTENASPTLGGIFRQFKFVIFVHVLGHFAGFPGPNETSLSSCLRIMYFQNQNV